jgi:hypothetical protein
MKPSDAGDFDIDGFLGRQSQPLSPFEQAFCRHYVRACLAAGESSEELIKHVLTQLQQEELLPEPRRKPSDPVCDELPGF